MQQVSFKLDNEKVFKIKGKNLGRNGRGGISNKNGNVTNAITESMYAASFIHMGE